MLSPLHIIKDVIMREIREDGPPIVPGKIALTWHREEDGSSFVDFAVGARYP
jgi:hypothetical protein